MNICSLLCTHIIYYHDSNKMRQFRHEIIMNVSLMWHSVLLRSSRRQLHGANVTSEQFVPHTGSLWRLHRFNLNRFQRNRRGKGYCFSRWLSRSRNMILAPQGFNAQRGFGHWKTADSFTPTDESERLLITVLIVIILHTLNRLSCIFDGRVRRRAAAPDGCADIQWVSGNSDGRTVSLQQPV